MKRFTPAALDSLTATIEEIEARSSAELVVVIRAQSGSYRDVDYLWGIVAALVGLLFIVFNPWTLHAPVWLPVETAMLFALGFGASRALPSLRRMLSSGRRREIQCEQGAAILFQEEGVGKTQARVGLLIYLSLLERRVELLADQGVLRAIPPETWGTIQGAFHGAAVAADPVAALLAAIRMLGETLVTVLPAGEENPDEIPNRPRMRK